MEGLAERWYRDDPRRFLPRVERLVLVSILLSVVVPALTATVLALELDRRSGTRLVVTALALYVVFTTVSFRWSRRRLGPLSDWLDGACADPGAAWIAAHGAPRLYLDRLMLQMGVPFAIVIQVLLSVDGAPWVGLVALAIGSVFAMAAAWIGFVVFMETLFRPILRDTSLIRDAGTVEPRGLGMALRLTAGLMGAAFPTGMAATALTPYGQSIGSRLALGVAGSISMATYTTTIFRTMVVRPVLHPIRELTAGAARVGAGDFTQPVPITSADELGSLVSSFNTMQRGLAERASLHAAFGTYVDPQLAERLLAQGDSTFSGEAVEVTVFFVDVRDFTSYSELVAPETALDRLNQLFSVVIPIVRERGGHPNRYLGDGVLAVFGAPEALPDHADRAVQAARDIQAAVATTFAGELRIGIGINTGPVIAGTIGGGGKLEYTVIGDPVNVAARVEELTKTTHDGVLLTDTTKAALRQPVELHDRGEFDIRGKTRRVRLHAVAAP
jgi:adenylate cyclase